MRRDRPARLAAARVGADDDVAGPGAVRPDRRRGARAAGRGGQAAVGVLRAVRQPRHRRPRAGRRRAARAAGALVLLDVKRGDIGSTSQAYADAYLDPASPLAADADHRQPLPRLRLAGPDGRHRPQARRRRVRARADLQQGGPRGAARHASTAATVAGRGARPAARTSTRAPSRSARSAPSSAPRIGDAREEDLASTARCSRPGTAPRAAPSPTSAGSSAAALGLGAGEHRARAAPARTRRRPLADAARRANDEPARRCDAVSAAPVALLLVRRPGRGLRRPSRSSTASAVEDHQAAARPSCWRAAVPRPSWRRWRPFRELRRRGAHRHRATSGACVIDRDRGARATRSTTPGSTRRLRRGAAARRPGRRGEDRDRRRRPRPRRPGDPARARRSRAAGARRLPDAAGGSDSRSAVAVAEDF